MTNRAKVQTMRNLSDKLTPKMKNRLCALIELGELKRAVDQMYTGKSLGPDRIVLEFY